MKKAVVIALALLMLFVFAACGETKIDFEGLDDELKNLTTVIDGEEQPAFGMMAKVDNEMTFNTFNIAESDVDEIFYMSPAMINVDCVLIVKPAKGREEAVQKGIDDYISAALALAEWYIPENGDRINNRLETELGDYKILIISFDAEAALNVIKAHA